MRIALIACQKNLPVIIYDLLKKKGHEVTVITFHEIGATLESDFSVSLGKIGQLLKYLKHNNIPNLVFAGSIHRPNLWKLRFDIMGLRLALKLLPFFKKGDDCLLRSVSDFIQKQGIQLHAISSLCPELLMPLGIISHTTPTQEHIDSVHFASNVLQEMSKFDIGQSIVVAGQVVLALEAIEGTDAMIKRIQLIDQNRLEHLSEPIFVKMRKKNQSDLADLPTIGPETIEQAIQSGIKGFGFEAGGCLIIDYDSVVAKINNAGLFCMGI